MSKTLFIENSPFLTHLVISDELKESIQVKQSKNNTLIVKNFPATILNRPNQNGRVYSTAEMQKALDAAKQQIQLKQLLCQADEHPEGSFVAPTHASHVITNAYIKKNVKLEVEGEKGTWDVLFCDIEVLNTQEGQNLQALILGGCGIASSIRGLGDMEGDQVVNYEFLGFDVVSNPSSGTWSNMPIYEAKIESIEENALNEATKFTVSTYASNTTHDLQQAMDFQDKVSSSLDYGTITNMNTKMDQEVDAKTGVEKTVGEVEVETSDDMSDLKTALEVAGRAFTNPQNVNVTSITIEKIDEDDDMQDSVMQGGASDTLKEDPEKELEEDALEEAPLWSKFANVKDWFSNGAKKYGEIKPEDVFNAVKNGKYNFLKACVDHGVNLKSMRMNDLNPLMYAAAHKNVDSVRALAQDMSLLNSQNKEGFTPLMYAVYGTQEDPVQEEIVQILLDNGAETSIKNKYNKTVFDYAQKKPYVLEILNSANNMNNDDSEETPVENPNVNQQATNNSEEKPQTKSSSKQKSQSGMADERFHIIQRLIADGNANVNAPDKNGYTPLDYAVMNHDEELFNFLSLVKAQHSDGFNKTYLNRRKKINMPQEDSVEREPEDSLKEAELAQGMWIKTQLLDPTAVYYVDEITDNGIYLIKNSENGHRIFIETDGSYIFPWEEVKDESPMDVSEPLPEATQLKENEKWVLAIDCVDGITYVQDLRDDAEYANDWDITEDENMAVVFDSEEAANEFKNQFIMQGKSAEELPTLNMFYAKKLENIEESAPEGEIEQNDNKLTIDVDGEEIEKEFKTDTEARIAKAGLENGELTANVMYNEAGSWWGLKVTAGDYSDWYVADGDNGIDVTADENMALVFPTEEEAKQFQVENNCEEYEYENGLRASVVPVQMGITDEEIFGKQEEANMDEKLYSKEDPASDDFQQQPVTEVIKDLKITLGDIAYDIDDKSDFEGDPSEIEKILNKLPDTIVVELNGVDVPEENAEQFVYEKACEQTGLPIKNATILDIEEIQ